MNKPFGLSGSYVYTLNFALGAGFAFLTTPILPGTLIPMTVTMAGLTLLFGVRHVWLAYRWFSGDLTMTS